MYAVIDIGSNTIRLSFYKKKGGKLESVMNKKEVAGLASYVDEKNNLNEEGVATLIYVLNEFKQIVKGLKPSNVYVFATASLRNVDNYKEVIKKVFKETGIKIDLISGEDEAAYGYFGAIQSVVLKEGLYIDIGGGSTELVFFKNKKILYGTSLKIGSLTAYNKFVSNLIPNLNEEKLIKDEVLRLLSDAGKIEGISLDNICGVGGSIRASLKLYEKITKVKANGYQVTALENLLDRGNLNAYIEEILKVKPDRIHTLTTGMVILKTIADYYSCKTIYISSYGVREGYLSSKLKGK